MVAATVHTASAGSQGACAQMAVGSVSQERLHRHYRDLKVGRGTNSCYLIDALELVLSCVRLNGDDVYRTQTVFLRLDVEA